jgi:pimeloyl-ACP methyl ester carboxylesterase
MANARITPFQIAIEPAKIIDLRDRLGRTRWSPEIRNQDWTFGTSGRYLRDVVEYWRDGFDWAEQEGRMNAFSHFRTLIDGLPVHFIHEQGRGPDPLPIVLTHGWPWTFWDWHDVIGPLTDPARYGGDPADSFHVVVPSLPGFTFSNPLETGGVTPPAIAERWDRLMRNGLGFHRYGAAGGDWGSFVTAELGIQFPNRLAGVYLSYPPRFHVDPDKVPESDYDPEEADWPDRQARRRATALSHVAVQTSSPQSLAWAFNDSPAGLAGWLLERRRLWSDCDGDVENAFTRDFLLTTISLYWLTESIGSSMRIYADTFGNGLHIHSTTPPKRIDVPTGIGVFPQELALLPRRACARAVNLVHWSVLPRGGHFAPSEQPELYVEELRRFFRPLR